ncbi:hypothetical protein VTN49DRAFT_2341 [Thermomyces lanuginosus]|uniref:uncharacterized protein n=1 Tax=Thermomyces lanuginosus TaxID=5541 RepID=UPI0037442425
MTLEFPHSHDGSAEQNPPRTLHEICNDLRPKVLGLLNEDTTDELLQSVQKKLRVSLAVIDQALKQYGPEQLSLSYNGGKDCLVLLVLVLACLPAWASSSSAPSETASEQASTDSADSRSPSPHTFPDSFQAIYIISQDPFPEVESFVAQSAAYYHLDLARYALPMRAALEAYLKRNKRIKAMFVGTRRTDPHGEYLTHFDPTDKDWPQFMRIHPVIDWHYAEIWAFIRHLGIPYCELYDRGFTSLGGMRDTHPNPALAVEGKPNKFRPAYELMDDGEERLGRDR